MPRRLNATLLSVSGRRAVLGAGTAVAGDRERPGMASTDARRHVNEIVHGAAVVRSSSADPRVRSTRGTRGCPVRARCPRCAPDVTHRYVAGPAPRKCRRGRLDVGQAFRHPTSDRSSRRGLVRRRERQGCGHDRAPEARLGDRTRLDGSFTSCTGRCDRARRRVPDPAGARVRRRRCLGRLRADAILRDARMPVADGDVHITASEHPAASASDRPAVESFGAGDRRSSPGLYRRAIHPLATRPLGSPPRFLRATNASCPTSGGRPLRRTAPVRRSARHRARAAATYFDRLVDYALLARWGLVRSAGRWAGCAPRTQRCRVVGWGVGPGGLRIFAG